MTNEKQKIRNPKFEGNSKWGMGQRGKLLLRCM